MVCRVSRCGFANANNDGGGGVERLSKHTLSRSLCSRHISAQFSPTFLPFVEVTNVSLPDVGVQQ